MKRARDRSMTNLATTLSTDTLQATNGGEHIPFRISPMAIKGCHSVMVQFAHKLKVLNPIIRPIAIEMVDNLCLKKCPSELLLHYKSVLINIFTWNPDSDIPVCHFASATFPSIMSGKTFGVIYAT